MDHFVETDILSTCNALGYEVKGVYQKSTDCLECLKDLLRYLRKDNENHSILRHLGSVRLLQTDLLPIVKRYHNDKEIFDFVLRLLVALTSPALLLFQEEVPDDKLSHNVYLQLVSYLQAYKKAFADFKVWEVLYEKLSDLLGMRPVERGEEENLIVERILIVMRNILHIPMDEVLFTKTDNNLSPQDNIIWCLHSSKVDVLILYLVSNEDEYRYCLHLIEIVSWMLREHSAEKLASASLERSENEKEKDVITLTALREQEQTCKKQKVQQIFTSRFNGVYSVKNMKSLGENNYISHKLISAFDDVKFDAKKNFKRKPKNRLPVKDNISTRQSSMQIRLMLRSFCWEFLKAYNKIMSSAKRELARKVSDDHDDTYYLWAIEYFMKFNRLIGFQAAYVSETISVQMFHYVQTQITAYHEMMLSDKNKSKIWSKRMRLGVSAYKELLKTMHAMVKTTDENIQYNAGIIINKVFYVVEYREMLLSLLSNYDEVKFSLTYLAELVESLFLFMRLLENHTKKHSEIIIQKKKRKTKKKIKKTLDKNSEEPININEKWMEIAPELSAVIQGRRGFLPETLPFDAASEIPFEEQKVNAVYQIYKALLSEDLGQAVSLLRASRDLWPDGNSFGANDIESEDEFLVLREICMSDLEMPKNEVNLSVLDEEEGSNEESEVMTHFSEEKLNLDDVYKRYATIKVIQPCCLLFSNYKVNSSQTNLCLIRFLHKIAWNYKMHALFFQSSVFMTFQKIFQDFNASSDPVIKELYRFAKFIINKFVDASRKNEKVFVELLFWKGSREAYELEEGYGAYETSSKSAAWAEDEEEELKYLFEENKNIHIEGQDVADIIVASLPQKKRSKHQVIFALKRLGLIETVKDLRPELQKEWREEELVELQELFDNHKTSSDILGNILNGLSIKRSRKAVVEKLLNMNLIHDRKEVWKKSYKKKISVNDDSEFNDDDDDNIYRNKEIMSAKNSDREYGNSSDNEDDEKYFETLKRDLNKDNFNLNTDYHEHSSNVEIKIGNEFQSEWIDNEVAELKELFIENKNVDNAVDIILKTLSFKKSRKDVINKLLKEKLITTEVAGKLRKWNLNSSAEVNSTFISENSENDMLDFLADDESAPVNKNQEEKQKTVKKKRPSKVWQEREIIELQHIFQENIQSLDIMGTIISMLTVKRSKDSIIEKMLELGLIKDRKEIRKKRQSKKTKILSATKVNDQDVSFSDSKNNANAIHNTPKAQKKNFEIWKEKEISKLKEIYNKHTNNPDILVLLSLKTKKSKESIREKLLELGLMKDNKLLKKTNKNMDLFQDDDTFKLSDTESIIGVKKRKRVVLSDSSDNETTNLLSMNVKHTYASEICQDTGTFIQSDSEKFIRRKKNKLILLSDSSDDENMSVFPNKVQNDTPVSKHTEHNFQQKKKHFNIDDSEDSEHDFSGSLTTEKVTDINTQSMKLTLNSSPTNSIDKTFIGKKRMRILSESD